VKGEVMKTKQIEFAVAEAKRFIKKAEICLEARSKTHGSGNYIFHNLAPKESGSVRRASLDLTRQLAEMRKP
jgi:hypothetical protein